MQKLHGSFRHKANSSEEGEMHQRMMVKVTAKRVQVQMDTTNLLAEGYSSLPSITDAAFPDVVFTPANLARHVYKMPDLTIDLYVDPNQVNTAKRNEKSLGLEFLKQSDFILVVVKEGKMKALLLSNDTAARIYVDLIKAKDMKQKVGHKAFLVRRTGNFYIGGQGPLFMEMDQINVISKSSWMKDGIVPDVQFLNGKMPTNEKFKARVENWKNFNLDAESIAKGLRVFRDIRAPELLSFGKPAAAHLAAFQVNSL